MSDDQRESYESRANFEEFQKTLEQIERVRKGITAEPVVQETPKEVKSESAAILANDYQAKANLDKKLEQELDTIRHKKLMGSKEDLGEMIKSRVADVIQKHEIDEPGYEQFKENMSQFGIKENEIKIAWLKLSDENKKAL